MRISSIIPIWLMIIICIVLIIIVCINKYKKKELIKKILIILILFCMNLRIMITSKDGTIISSDLDVLFVIDNTISMLAEDSKGVKNRLEAIKRDCSYIVSRLNGSRFSIITFNDISQVLIPFTKDTNITLESIDTIRTPNQYYAMGSSLNVAMDDMKKQLESAEKKEDRKKILFFISDGEITNDKKLESFESLKNYLDGGAVLGYGTTNGGNIKVKNYNDEEEYLVDYSSSTYPTPKAVSKMDEDNLKKIASDLDIEYVHMQKESDIDSVLNAVTKNINTSPENSDRNTYVDTYYYFAIPLLVLLISEFISYKKKL